MTSPTGGNSIDKVSVKVVPDTSTFAEDLRADLDRIAKDAKISIGVTPDTTTFAEDLRADVARATEDVRPQVPVTPEFDSTQLREQADTAAQEAKPQVQFTPQLDSSAVRTEAAKAAKAANPAVNYQARIDAAQVRAQAQEAASAARAQVVYQAALDKAKLLPEAEQAAAETKAKVTFDASIDEARVKAQASLAAAEAQAKIKYDAEVNAAQVREQAAEAARLAELGDSTKIHFKADVSKVKFEPFDDSAAFRSQGSKDGNAYGGSFINSLAKFKVGIVGALVGGGVLSSPFLSGLIVQVTQLAGGLIALVPAGIAAAGAIGGTLALGLHGFSTAIEDAGTPQFAKDLKNLAPSAAAAATEIASLKPALAKLELSTQQALFAGLSGDIKDLATSALPVLTTGTTQVANGINADAQALVKFLASKSAMADISNIFANTGAATGILKTGLTAGASAFLKLAQVGSTFLPQLAQDFDNIANRFNAFITRVSASGQLSTWIQNAITDAGQLFKIVGNLGSGLFTFFSIFQSQGGNALGTLVGITGAFKSWVNTPGANSFLTELSQTLSDIGADFGPAVSAAFGDLSDILSTLLPYVQKLAAYVGPSLAADLRNLKKPAEDFATQIGKFATGPFAHTVIDTLGALVKAIQWLDQNLPGVTKVSEEFVLVWTAAKFTGVLGQLSKLGTAIGGVGTAASEAGAAGGGGSGGIWSLLGLGAAGTATLGASALVVPVAGVWAGLGLVAANAFKTGFAGGGTGAGNKFIQQTLGIPQAEAAGLAAANAAVGGWTRGLAPMGVAISTQIGNVGAALRNAQPGLVNTMSVLGGSLVSSLATELAGGPPVVTKAGSALQNAFAAGQPAFSSIGGSVGFAGVNAMGSALASGQSQVRGSASLLQSAVSGALGGTGAIGTAAGASLISGLASELRSGQDLVGKIASDITATLKANKGPLSRDKVLWKPAGQAIVGGLFDVLDAAVPDAAAKARSMTQALTMRAPNTRGALGYGAPAAGPSGTLAPTVNVYGAPGQDPNAIATAASRKLGFALTTLGG